MRTFKDLRYSSDLVLLENVRSAFQRTRVIETVEIPLHIQIYHRKNRLNQSRCQVDRETEESNEIVARFLPNDIVNIR